MSEQEWEDKLEEVQKHSEHWYKMYTKQKEINKELVDENESLKSQIEKMKCCANCKHSRTEYEHCKTDKHEKWEIKEK